MNRNKNLQKNIDEIQYDKFMQQWGMNKSRNAM